MTGQLVNFDYHILLLFVEKYAEGMLHCLAFKCLKKNQAVLPLDIQTKLAQTMRAF